MGLIDKCKKYDKKMRAIREVISYAEVKESLKKRMLNMEFAYHSYRNSVSITTDRVSLSLSLEEAKALRNYLNKLF